MTKAQLIAALAALPDDCEVFIDLDETPSDGMAPILEVMLIEEHGPTVGPQFAWLRADLTGTA